MINNGGKDIHTYQSSECWKPHLLWCHQWHIYKSLISTNHFCVRPYAGAGIYHDTSTALYDTTVSFRWYEQDIQSSLHWELTKKLLSEMPPLSLLPPPLLKSSSSSSSLSSSSCHRLCRLCGHHPGYFHFNRDYHLVLTWFWLYWDYGKCNVNDLLHTTCTITTPETTSPVFLFYCFVVIVVVVVFAVIAFLKSSMHFNAGPSLDQT